MITETLPRDQPRMVAYDYGNSIARSATCMTNWMTPSPSEVGGGGGEAAGPGEESDDGGGARGGAGGGGGRVCGLSWGWHR
jgi:hypothetical protein